MNPIHPENNHYVEMPEDVFRLIRDLIYERSGIYFQDSSRYILQKRLSPRVRLLNFDSFQKYFYFLHYDPRAESELEMVFDAVTTNETYFFREPAQLDAFAQEIIPEILRRKPHQKIRIWSAGCSSGEEPFTVAMLLAEREHGEEARFEIFASDINHEVLARARSGRYRDSSFRSTPPHLKEKYFVPEADGSWRISDEIRNLVSFGRLNLYDHLKVSLVGAVDVIFCRNVIIYFDDASKRRVINSFHDRLVEDGYLLLGHAESLISLSTDFKLRHLEHDMVYQK